MGRYSDIQADELVPRRALIALDVFLDSQDDLGDTALHKAILQGYDDLSFILIRAGSEITKRNTNDETPLDLATRLNRTAVRESLDGLESIDKKMPSSAVFKEILLNADVINYKRVIGLYPDILKNYESMNLLALAVASKSELRGFEISLSLIALKVSIDGPEGAETTPLIQAVKLKRKSFVELIIRSGPALDKTDRKDKPALHYAIENNDEGMVDLLVTSGAQEKFEILKNNRKVTFRGCRVADSQQRKLTTPEELAMNRKIQLRLGCRWTR